MDSNHPSMKTRWLDGGRTHRVIESNHNASLKTIDWDLDGMQTHGAAYRPSMKTRWLDGGRTHRVIDSNHKQSLQTIDWGFEGGQTPSAAH